MLRKKLDVETGNVKKKKSEYCTSIKTQATARILCSQNLSDIKISQILVAVIKQSFRI